MIFINYRREDTGAYAGRLHDRLRDRFGSALVFMDLDIPPGSNFADVIGTHLSSCRVLVALIGPRWITSASPDGHRRLDDDHDIVRLELRTALQRKICVVPILVGGASFPKDTEFPRDIADLAQRQAFAINDARFHRDVDLLVRALSDILDDAGPVPPDRRTSSKPHNAGLKAPGRRVYLPLVLGSLGLTLVTWIFLYERIPAAPLTLRETLLVLAAWLLALAVVKWFWQLLTRCLRRQRGITDNRHETF